MKEQELIVMKFGGSSVANADRFCHAANIIRNYSRNHRVVVVVSAIQGVTDQLYRAWDDFNLGNYQSARKKVEGLVELHEQVAVSFQDRPFVGEINRSIRELLLGLDYSLVHPSEKDFVVSYGERLSSVLLSKALLVQGVNSRAIDAVNIIVTNCEYGNAKASLDLSQTRARAHLEPLLNEGFVPIVGGFYGISEEGRIAVLGRGGSDYSAAILAHVLNAGKLILWKEIDGIFDSDPKKNPFANFLPVLSYDEAEALARNGAKILHPESIGSLREKNIPVWVKNFNDPNAPGSRINGKINFEGR